MWFKTMRKVHCPFVASKHNRDSMWDDVSEDREEQDTITLQQILWDNEHILI